MIFLLNLIGKPDLSKVYSLKPAPSQCPFCEHFEKSEEAAGKSLLLLCRFFAASLLIFLVCRYFKFKRRESLILCPNTIICSFCITMISYYSSAAASPCLPSFSYHLSSFSSMDSIIALIRPREIIGLPKGRIASAISFMGLSSAAVRLELILPQLRQR